MSADGTGSASAAAVRMLDSVELAARQHLRAPRAAR